MATRRATRGTKGDEPQPTGHGDEEPVRTWTLRLLAHSNVYARLPAYSEELATVLAAIGLKPGREEKPAPSLVARHIQRALRSTGRTAEGQDLRTLRRNVEMLGALLGLDEVAQGLLGFLALAVHRAPLRACLRTLERMTPRGLASLLAHTLALPEAGMQAALEPRAPLRHLRLLRLEHGAYLEDGPLVLLDRLEEHLFEEHSDVAALLAGFVRLSRPAQLTRADYPHLARELDLLERLLRAASAQGSVGVNVLLYGASGTGKTELARVVAAQLGVPLHDVQAAGPDDKVLGGYERLSAYQLCQRLAHHSRPALVLFDEVEDVFRSPAQELFESSGGGHDKGYMTRLLEENPVPALWVCNRIDAIDPALRRRFDLVLEVPTPPERVRRAILDRALGALEVRSTWAERMASDDALTPAHIERAVRVARLVDAQGLEETTATLDRVLRGSLAVTRTGAAPSRRQATLGYDLALLSTDPPLAPLVDALTRSPSATLCLHGPPGTGKTAFVAHLARSLDRPLLLRRASELLGPFVGQTEANLAEAFQRATTDGAVLFLDEVDSFLQRRDTAGHSWEITQVNELLTQMDTFDGVFVCATNRLEHLDPRSLRRFDVRVRFSYLAREPRQAIFARALADLRAAPVQAIEDGARRRLDHLDNLTPGDFAAVVRRLRLLGGTIDEAALVRELEAEARGKTDGSRSPVGFSA